MRVSHLDYPHIPALSKLNKQQKVEILILAIKRRNRRMEAGEIIPEVSGEVDGSETEVGDVESIVEEDDIGYTED